LDEKNWANREIRQFVGAFLLRSAREERNLPLFDEIRTFFNTNLVPDQTTETCILYERCLWARDELDFRELRNLLPALAGVDPIWRIRRAALHCDLGDLPAARENVAQGLREIRERFYRNRDSLSLVSRIAWAQFLSRTLRPLESMGQEEPPDESDILHLRIVETKSDPWDVIANLEREIEESVRKVAERMRTREPQFEAGVYKDNSSTLHFGSWAPQDAIYEAARIVDIAGAPARADHFQVMSSRLERAEAIAVSQYENETDYLRLLRVVQAGSESLLKEAFGRIQIARLSEANFGMLWCVLNRALEYAVDQIRFRKGFADDSWSRRAAIYAELLSRLSVRLDDTRALALFKSSLQSANDPRWRVRELLEPLENLLIRSLSAVPPPRRSPFILDILQFPLPDEAGIGHPFDHDWPDSFKFLSMITAVRPQRDAEFASRIDVLIDKTQNCPTEVRSRAARLLTKLYMDSVLTEQESLRFGNALWARRKSIVELPCDTTLYSHIFLLLPSPEPQETIRSLVMARCHELTSSDNFISLASASQKRADGKPALLLTREEATAKLAGILAWHPRNDDNPFHPVVIENRETRRAIGAALANAIFPALSPGDLTDAQVQDCMSHLEKELDYSAAQALPQFLRIAPTQTDRVIKLIIRSMVSPKSDCAWAGFNAIYRWLALTKDNSVPDMPRKLIDTLLAVIETNRKPGLLHAVNIAPYLIEANLFARDDVERIADALGLIRVESDYVNQGFSDDGAITLTLLRASAVKLAHALSGTGIANSNVDEWLRTATTDPIPEVRFAFITPEELS
jgi:hypothetical protein